MAFSALRAVGTRAFWKKVFGGGRIVALVLLLIFTFIRFENPEVLEMVRAKVFDQYQRWKPRIPETNAVTVVDLDERSLAEVGQWPWARTKVAKLVDNLTAMGAVVVAFDIVFAEPDRLSPSLMAENLSGLPKEFVDKVRELPTNDQVFAESIGKSRVVLGQATVTGGAPEREDIPTSVAFIGGDPSRWVPQYQAMTRNLSILDEAAVGRGVFSVYPEADNVIRRVPAFFGVSGKLHPALSVEILRVATGNQTIGARVDPKGQEGILFFTLRPNRIETDEYGRIWVYASRYDAKKYVAAVDVLNGTVDPNLINGKIIILGTSAAGLFDIRATAVEPSIPGVDVHVQIIETVLDGMQLKYPREAKVFEMILMLGAGAIMILLMPMVGARWTLVLFLGIAGGAAGWSWYQFAEQRLLYDPVFPIFTTLLLYMQLTYSAYANEEQQRRQVRGAFSRYMSPALVEQLAADPTKLKLGGEMRDMTLLFCDVRGFTTISEQFDAQGLTKLINAFLTPMTNIILERRGTIDKYMGDCIMAFWNAPLDDEDHAKHACDSALSMMRGLQPLNDGLEAEAKQEGRKHVPIVIGIGLNSGTVCVGNMGSEQRFDYSVLGDTVNLASRLEGQSKPYGVHIVIGDETKKRAPEFATLELDRIKVKGKTEAVTIHTLLGYPELAETPEFKALEVEHNAMLKTYREQDWNASRAHLKRCLELNPGLYLEHFYEIYVERFEEFESAPPGANWDGVYVATSK
jgi:adenylate cyclase